MGIAVLSGVLASLESTTTAHQNGQNGVAAKWESHTPGTLTPTVQSASDDESLPSRYLACVSREESAKRLRSLFISLGSLGPSVEVLVGENVRAVLQADVVILWYVPCRTHTQLN